MSIINLLTFWILSISFYMLKCRHITVATYWTISLLGRTTLFNLNIIVSDFISHHKVLHACLKCVRPHPTRKQVQVRALRRVKGRKLDAALTSIDIDTVCGDVNTVAIQYDDR